MSSPQFPCSNFLFWNLNGKPLGSLVAELARERDLDFVVLAECPDVSGIARELASVGNYDQPFSVCEKIRMFVRFPSQFVAPVHESPRLSIQKVFLAARNEVLLAAVHLPSKLHWSADSQLSEATQLALEIRDAEKLSGITKTLLVGDFNMNPFESGMMAAPGFHATMSRAVSARTSRTVQARA